MTGCDTGITLPGADSLSYVDKLFFPLHLMQSGQLYQLDGQ
ncbi:hypothetical protein [Nitrosomonas sp.]|nr:hypothetical protein [Nitrosomonas sp.]